MYRRRRIGGGDAGDSVQPSLTSFSNVELIVIQYVGICPQSRRVAISVWTVLDPQCLLFGDQYSSLSAQRSVSQCSVLGVHCYVVGTECSVLVVQCLVPDAK